MFVFLRDAACIFGNDFPVCFSSGFDVSPECAMYFLVGFKEFLVHTDCCAAEPALDYAQHGNTVAIECYFDRAERTFVKK